MNYQCNFYLFFVLFLFFGKSNVFSLWLKYSFVFLCGHANKVWLNPKMFNSITITKPIEIPFYHLHQSLSKQKHVCKPEDE